MKTENVADATENSEIQTSEFDEFLVTVATGLRDMMERTKTNKEALAKKVGKPVEYIEAILDGFYEDLDDEMDLKPLAAAMNFTVTLNNAGEAKSDYEIRDGSGKKKK